ncbi:MAG: tetratricopeptide repeat protein [Bacteroidota bacterium]|jgi:TolA-binding protein
MKFILFTFVLMFALNGCSKPSAEEMFSKGVDAQKAEQYDAAITSYQELIAAYPESARTPEAWYAIGTIYQNHKQSYHQAIHTFRQLVEKYPNHATSPSASFLIGFIYNNDLKNIDSARIAYEDFIKQYPTNQLVASAQFELSNLGKDPAEILKAQAQVAQEETKPAKKVKKK